jgi:hypothetical protein
VTVSERMPVSRTLKISRRAALPSWLVPLGGLADLKLPILCAIERRLEIRHGAVRYGLRISDAMQPGPGAVVGGSVVEKGVFAENRQAQSQESSRHAALSGTPRSIAVCATPQPRSSLKPTRL